MTSEFGMAVHALTFLNHKGEIVSSEALAKNICTNPARVRKVMAKLKKAGLVDTKEGLEGGYLFSKDAQKVDLSMWRMRWRPDLFPPPGKAEIRIWIVWWHPEWRACWTGFMMIWILYAIKG